MRMLLFMVLTYDEQGGGEGERNYRLRTKLIYFAVPSLPQESVYVTDGNIMSTISSNFNEILTVNGPYCVRLRLNPFKSYISIRDP